MLVGVCVCVLYKKTLKTLSLSSFENLCIIAILPRRFVASTMKLTVLGSLQELGLRKGAKRMHMFAIMMYVCICKSDLHFRLATAFLLQCMFVCVTWVIPAQVKW